MWFSIRISGQPHDPVQLAQDAARGGSSQAPVTAAPAHQRSLEGSPQGSDTERLPVSAEVVAFAAVRTMSGREIDGMLAPVVGVISYTQGRLHREP